MTVIAAVARDGRVVMGADRQTNCENHAVHGARKIRRIPVGDTGGYVLLAAAGNGAMPNLLAQHLKVEQTPGPDDDTPAVQDWADVIASAATEVLAGTEPAMLTGGNHDEPRSMDGALLLALRGRLFYLFTHQTAYVPDGVAALGSGADVALGAMHVALDRGDAPDAAVTSAVALACRFSPYCGVGDRGPLLDST